MRTMSSLGAVAAATALGAATILAGAGVANAQGAPDPTFTSASELSVERNSDGEIEVSYSNKSDRDLTCTVIIGEEELLSEMYDEIKSADSIISEEPMDMPADLEAKFNAAVEAGTLGAGMYTVDAGGEGLMQFVPLELEGLSMPTDTEFAPDAISMCMAGDMETELPDYIEVETTFSTGVLSNVLGSVDVFGSLGSLGL